MNDTREQETSNISYDCSDITKMLTMRIDNIPTDLVEEHFNLMCKLKAKNANANVSKLKLRNAIIQAYKDSIEELKQTLSAVN